MIFRYEPRQTGRAGFVRIAEGKFPGGAGARPGPLDETCQAETFARRASVWFPLERSLASLAGLGLAPAKAEAIRWRNATGLFGLTLDG